MAEGLGEKMSKPTKSDTLEEILQLHWMDGAKLSGGSYATEPSLDADQALTALTEREERLVLEAKIEVLKAFRRQDFKLDSVYEAYIINQLAQLQSDLKDKE